MWGTSGLAHPWPIIWYLHDGVGAVVRHHQQGRSHVAYLEVVKTEIMWCPCISVGSRWQPFFRPVSASYSPAAHGDQQPHAQLALRVSHFASPVPSWTRNSLLFAAAPLPPSVIFPRGFQTQILRNSPVAPQKSFGSRPVHRSGGDLHREVGSSSA